jgi:adenosylcobinamide-phosphate synthase
VVPTIVERIGTLTIALILDAVLGEPSASYHPVVWIGRLVAVLESRAPRASRGRALIAGGVTTVVTVAATIALSSTAERLLGRQSLVARLLVGGALLKPTFAVRELFAAAERVRVALAADDLPAARTALRSLVSRDVQALDRPLVAAAAVESLSENASDAIVAPWLAYLVAGLPGAYAYRAINTLDAMIGYHGRYEYYGKCAAHLDDLVNLVPARLTAALIVLGAGPGGGAPRQALAIARRDHRRTASPNAGWPMSAMAGAIGVELQKVDHYCLGEPEHAVGPSDIQAAQHVVTVGLSIGLAIGLAILAMVAWAENRRERRSR